MVPDCQNLMIEGERAARYIYFLLKVLLTYAAARRYFFLFFFDDGTWMKRGLCSSRDLDNKKELQVRIPLGRQPGPPRKDFLNYH